MASPPPRDHGDAASADSAAPRRILWLAVLLAALVVQLLVLYLPRVGTGGAPQGSDLLVHAAIFAAPAVAAVLAGMRPWLVALVLGAHAVVSELAQHLLLPERSGDPIDVVADLVGLAIGLAAGVALARRRTRSK